MISRDMALIKYLAKLGYGTRRDVTALVAARRVTRADGTAIRDADAFTHADTRVDGEPLDPPPASAILLHKPPGFVCSTSDIQPLVYDLLPARFQRRTPIMAPVGRLDRDTSGLLLLTDDGALNHRLTSPRSQLSKTYLATLANDLTGAEHDTFASGLLMLSGETTPLAPAQLRRLAARQVELTIIEGRYHQVRRMFAAVGNHVESLHRVSVGALTLGDLPAGRWRVLAHAELTTLASVAHQAP
jgi:16S rRNA pseudouridine516 synthase